MTAEPRTRTAAGARRLLLPAVVLVAVALRGGLLVSGAVPFNSDEAVVGLMARHILHGERPVFFYGQAYLGSLDAWLVAGAFALMGQSVAAIRLVQIALFAGTLGTTYWLGRKIFGSDWVAGAAALLLAVPPVLVTLYSTVSLGGYGEMLLIGNLLILLALHLLDPMPGDGAAGPPGQGRMSLVRSGGWLMLGLLGGLGFWSFPLIVVYLIPILIYAGIALRRRVRLILLCGLLFGAGFVVGAAPWIWYTWTHGLATVLEIGGSAIAGASVPNPVFAALLHLYYFLLFGPTVVWGIRPPWSATLLALALIPYALATNAYGLVFAIRRTLYRQDRATPGRWLLAGVSVCVVLGFVLTPFGADPSGRYFLPMAVPAALFLGEMFNWLRLRRHRLSPGRKWFAQALALGLIAFNWWGNVQSAAAFPPGLTTQFDVATQVDQRSLTAVMAFLREHGETRGYTNYWVEYPLAFLSHEELIFVARLPYHPDLRYTARDDRYPPYDGLVAASPRVAYVTAHLPELSDHLRIEFGRRRVTYQEASFGDFHIFYDLSRKVTPDELGIGGHDT